MKKTFNILLVLSLWTVSFSTTFAQTIRYVKPTPSGTGDGTSWANASASPQLMINAAAAGDEIWVAAGTYLPTHDPFGSTTPTDPRDKTFYLKNGVKLYGGFVGTETALSERNWQTNATILSGDFNGNDVVSNTVNNNTENAYHVILSVSDNSATVLDGFTVRGGYGNGSGSIIVETKSISRIAGAGMHNNTSSPTIQNCIFYANTVYSGNGNGGGGIYNTASAPNINNCLFRTNTLASASGVPPVGGAILNVAGSSATITNCMFTSNSGSGGSCIRNTSANPIIFNCTFSANSGKPIISNSSTNTNLTIKNCIIWSNGTGAPNIDIINASGADATVTNCITNIAYTGTGSNNSTSDPKFINSSDPDGADNIWFTADDGYRLGCSSPAVNTGSNTGAPASDVLGNSIFATTKDMGAYEMQGDATILPTVYTITGGGSYCSGGTGVAVGLTNSETTATYQLKNGASNVGAAATGVGTAFNYNNQTVAGTYTVVATNAANGCTANMTGNAVITITPTVTPSISIVSDDADNSINAGTSVTFTASQTNGGTTPQYQWQKNGANVGANDPSYTTTTLANNDVITVILTSNETCPSIPTAMSNEITMSVSGTVLSVELRDFKGTPQYNGNLLTWTTANEVNNKGFQIERIMDNPEHSGWTILGFKTANNKASSYDFTDNTPLSTSYYRLRQIDNDGKETLSKVISISTKGSAKLKAYPSITTGFLTVETTETSDYHIFNLFGQQVLSSRKSPLGVGGIDVSALPQGSYFLKVGAEQVKFIKQ